MNVSECGRGFAVAALLGVCFVASIQAADLDWKTVGGQSTALIKADVVIWQFNYGPDVAKPFFHPVGLPDGRVITWNQPPDHRWHHGLWFSWKYLNRVNYWEPDGKTGKPAGRTAWGEVKILTRPDFSATIEMPISYGPQNGRIILKEQRKIDISAPAADGTYEFAWTSQFTAQDVDVTFDRTPLPDEPGGKAWGGYAGLSVRLAKDLAERGADTVDGPVKFNDQSRFRGKALALDYHGLIDGKPMGVAIFDDPGNLNHPSPWYVIRATPMSYFSPAVICYGPYTLKSHESFTLKYRVIIHSGRWNAKQLRERAKGEV